jgi:hypothetical protein
MRCNGDYVNLGYGIIYRIPVYLTEIYRSGTSFRIMHIAQLVPRENTNRPIPTSYNTFDLKCVVDIRPFLQ